MIVQGHGVPENVHPHFVYKEHHDKHTNHTQQSTYLSKVIKDSPDQFDAIMVPLEDICRMICELLCKHLPGVYDHL
jgi:hypothetical protein